MVGQEVPADGSCWEVAVGALVAPFEEAVEAGAGVAVDPPTELDPELEEEDVAVGAGEEDAVGAAEAVGLALAVGEGELDAVAVGDGELSKVNVIAEHEFTCGSAAGAFLGAVGATGVVRIS